jgi:hypothetical protein
MIVENGRHVALPNRKVADQALGRQRARRQWISLSSTSLPL